MLKRKMFFSSLVFFFFPVYFCEYSALSILCRSSAWRYFCRHFRAQLPFGWSQRSWGLKGAPASRWGRQWCLADVHNSPEGHTFPKADSVGALQSGVKNVYRINFTLSWWGGGSPSTSQLSLFSRCCCPGVTHLFIAIVLKEEGRLQGHWDCTGTAQSLFPKVLFIKQALLSFSSSLSFWGRCLTFWWFSELACSQSSLKYLYCSFIWKFCM